MREWKKTTTTTTVCCVVLCCSKQIIHKGDLAVMNISQMHSDHRVASSAALQEVSSVLGLELKIAKLYICAISCVCEKWLT